MPTPAADRTPHRAPKAFAALAGLACAACCLLPALIAAGVVGTGASAIVGWLPALAVALTVLAGATSWRARRAAGSCGSSACGRGGCGCQTVEDPLRITGLRR